MRLFRGRDGQLQLKLATPLPPCPGEARGGVKKFTRSVRGDIVIDKHVCLLKMDGRMGAVSASVILFSISGNGSCRNSNVLTLLDRYRVIQLRLWHFTLFE